jgi:hypothetical protein
MTLESSSMMSGVWLDSQRATTADRLRRLPEAVLLTAGYYASRIPVLNELIRRLD